MRKEPPGYREALLKFSTVVDHFLVPSEGTKAIQVLYKLSVFSTKVNGEAYSREWLVYSPAKGRVCCFVCKLFPNHASSTLASDGFDDWCDSYLMQAHENSEKHRNAMLTYLTRKRRHTLTSKLEEQIKAEEQLAARRGMSHRCNLHSCRTRLTVWRGQSTIWIS